MSSRVPLQMMSNNLPEYSSMMYEPYYNYYYCENPSMSMENFYPPTCDVASNSISLVRMDTKKKSNRRSKHIPHHLRPQHIVERRNKRERLRVQDVNQAFDVLQQLLPFDSNSTISDNQPEQLLPFTHNASRVSKAQTLRKAAEYIEALQQMLIGNY